MGVASRSRGARRNRVTPRGSVAATLDKGVCRTNGGFGLAPITDRSSTYPAMGRRPNTSARTQLLDAGLAAFIRDGYHGAGLTDILASVSIPKGSFYAYFDSKEDYAVAVIDHYAACFRAKFDAAMAAKPSPLAALRAFFAGLRREFKAAEFAGGCLVANLAGEIEDSEPCREALKRAYAGWTTGVRDALRRAQAAGEVRSDVKAEELADLLVDSWEGAVIRMKVERSTAPLDRCIKRHFDGFLLP